MDLALKRNVEERQKDISHIELLIAAGNGDAVNAKLLTEENADVNFVDTDGNTALHYAVRNGNLEVIQLLLDHMVDTNIENKEDETPLDIASRLPKESIINALGEKEMNKAFKLLNEAVVDATADDTVLPHTNVALTRAEQEIRKTEDKMKYCLEAIDKLKECRSNNENLSYEQANVIIYFFEAFALEGSGDEDVKNKLKEHFSQYYSESNRITISDARDLLFKSSAKKIRLQDVCKFIKGDINTFFQKLNKYVQCIHDKIKGISNHDEVELLSFLNVLKGKERNIGEKIDDTRAFLKKEFEKIIGAAYGRQKITSEELFSFALNFYPAFDKETRSGFLELRDMRNKLIHEFHKYGDVEFGSAIYSLRSRLFKYYYAQEVIKVTSATEPDENPEKLSSDLKKKLDIFKEQFKRDYRTEQVISQEDANVCLGYVFSDSLFPERDENGIEELVDQYLKFMVIFDSEKNEQYLTDTDSNQEDALDLTETDYEERPQHQQKDLSDVDRREIFEKFCRLKRIKNYSSNTYSEEMLKLRDELTKIYGVNGYYFDEVCASYVQNNNEFSQNDKITVKEIAKNISNLKKLRDNYKLSNQVVVSLYDRLFGKQGFSVSEENQNLLRNIDERMEQEIKKQLPRDKTLEISIGTELFSFRLGKVISNMLKTFYNAYHKYQVEFNVEEIFNDDIFLDYLVRTEVKEKDIIEAIDAYFKLLVFICSAKQKRDHEEKVHEDMDIKEIFRIFKTLKKCRGHFCDLDYNDEKEILKKTVADKNVWFSVSDFDKLCELFIENDYELLDEKEIQEVEKVKSVANNLKVLGFPWKIIKTLYELLLHGKGNLQLEDLSFLKNSDESRKKKVKENLEKLYANDLAESKINMTFGRETFNLQTSAAIAAILEIFKDELHFKKPFFTYMVIKKLLNIEYCAPYIVKLITEVNNDDIIEKRDLLMLVDILLKKDGGMYIKHLHALLNTGSAKIKLHEEICKKIVEHNVNIKNLRMIVKEPRHLCKLLNILKRKIEPTCNFEKAKFIDLVKETLKLLNSIVLEMRHSLSYDVALEVLYEANDVQEKMIQLNLIDKTDLNALETKCQIGRVKNILGMQEPDKFNKAVLHEEALAEFRGVHEILRYMEISGEEREIKVHEMPLFLLVLSEIAYTKQLLERYKESCDELENLCQEIVKFVLDLPKTNCLPDDFLNAQMYAEVEKSKNYQELLTFSEESKKYLDILNIKSSFAYGKSSMGLLEATDRRDFQQAMDYYYEALAIHKQIYTFRKKSMGIVYQTVVPAVRHISFVCSGISYFWLKMDNVQNALLFNYLALQKQNKVYESQKDIFWSNHMSVLKSQKRIVKHLRGIANAHSACAQKMPKEERKRWFEKSLEINTNIYNILLPLYGEKYYLTLNTMYNVGFQTYHFGRLQEAKTILQKLHDIQTEMFGEHNPKVLKVAKLLDSINVKLR